MEKAAIRNRLDQIETLADDQFLWPVAITTGRRESAKHLRQISCEKQFSDLHRRAERLCEGLQEDARRSEFSEGQALAELLEAATTKEIEDSVHQHPYLRSSSASQRLEQMALRARRMNRPEIELSCWQRAAFVGTMVRRRSASRHRLLEELAKRAGELQKSDQQEQRRGFAASLLKLGISRARGEERDGAERALQAAVFHHRLLFNNHGGTRNEGDLARTLNNLALAKARQSRHKGAERDFRDAVDHHESVFQAKQTAQARRDLANSLKSLARTQREQGKNSEAEKSLKDLAEHQRKLSAGLPPGSSAKAQKKELAETLQNLGAVCLKQKKLEEARDAYEKSSNLWRELLEERNALADREQLAGSLRNLGIIYSKRLQWEQAEDFYLRATEHLRHILDQGRETAQRRAELAESLFGLGGAQFNQTKIRAAEESLDEVVSHTDMVEPQSFREGRERFRECRWGSLRVLALCAVQRSQQPEAPEVPSLQKAKSRARQALGEFNAYRRKIGSYSQRRALRRKWNDLYETRREVAFRLDDPESALRWTSGAKARSLAELIRGGRG